MATSLILLAFGTWVTLLARGWHGFAILGTFATGIYLGIRWDLFLWVIEYPWRIWLAALLLFMYLGLGVLYSQARWRRHVTLTTLVIDSVGRESFYDLNERGLQLFDSLRARNNQARIAAWVSIWPLDLPLFWLEIPVRKAWDELPRLYANITVKALHEQKLSKFVPNLEPKPEPAPEPEPEPPKPKRKVKPKPEPLNLEKKPE